MDHIDERIKKDIIDHLYWDDRIDASRVKVEVEDGVKDVRVELPIAR